MDFKRISNLYHSKITHHTLCNQVLDATFMVFLFMINLVVGFTLSEKKKNIAQIT